MRFEIVWVFVVATLPYSALAEKTKRVSVSGQRVFLADVLHPGGGDVPNVDLGPSPHPGERAWLTRDDIQRRLDQAMVSIHSSRIPASVEVRRLSRKLSEPELKSLLQREIEAKLPEGATLRHLTVGGGLVVPHGDVQAQVDVPRVWRSGRQSFRTLLTFLDDGSGSGSAPVALMTTVDVDVPRASERVLVRRGDRLVVQVNAPGVRVRTRGVAQQDGALGDLVAVIPSAGSKILHARVVSATEVEVQP